MAPFQQHEIRLPNAPGSGMPMRERLRIFGIGAGIGLMMVGLYFARRSQLKQVEAQAAAEAAAADAAAGLPPSRFAAPAEPVK